MSHPSNLIPHPWELFFDLWQNATCDPRILDFCSSIIFKPPRLIWWIGKRSILAIWLKKGLIPKYLDHIYNYYYYCITETLLVEENFKKKLTEFILFEIKPNLPNYSKVTRMHSSMVRYSRTVTVRGSPWQRPHLARQRPPGQRPPGQRPSDRDIPGQKLPWTETPLDRDPPERDLPLDRDPPGQRLPWRETP